MATTFSSKHLVQTCQGGITYGLKKSVTLFHLHVKPLLSFPEDLQATLNPAG